MQHEELTIKEDNCEIKADLKIPDLKSKVGTVFSHGGFVNRKSLSRNNYCLAEYFCNELKSYVITPDILGETIYYKDEGNQVNFHDMTNVLDICVEYLVEKFGVEKVFGFGHSLGGLLLARFLREVRDVDAISIYGTPTHLDFDSNFIKMIINFLKITTNFRRDLSFHHFKSLLDKETQNYYSKVMMKNSEYHTENNNLNFDTQFITEVLTQKMLFQDLEDSGKPALVLFGIEDSIVSRSCQFFKNGYKKGNIIVHHISEGHHITPCREEKNEIKKLDIMIEFFKNTMI